MSADFPGTGQEQSYDAFTPNVIPLLEVLGFLIRGEGGVPDASSLTRIKPLVHFR
jgi:hypothetical protein